VALAAWTLVGQTYEAFAATKAPAKAAAKTPAKAKTSPAKAKANADPSLVQPKRPGSSYMLWLAENRASIAKSVGDASVTAIAKAAGEQWGELDAKKKASFEKQASAAKAKYLEEMEAFKAKGGVPVFRKEKKVKKVVDPNRPKRPSTAYFLWLSDNRKAIAKSLGDSAGVTQIASEAGKRWKALSGAEKAPLQTKADKLMQEYKKAISAYKP